MNPVMDWHEVPVVLTTEEAADLLRVHANTVLSMIADGDIPAAKVGRAWRISRDMLKAYVEAAPREELDKLNRHTIFLARYEELKREGVPLEDERMAAVTFDFLNDGTPIKGPDGVTITREEFLGRYWQERIVPILKQIEE